MGRLAPVPGRKRLLYRMPEPSGPDEIRLNDRLFTGWADRMLLRQLLKIAAVFNLLQKIQCQFLFFYKNMQCCCHFAIIVFSRRKDWPSLYHSLGRQTYTLRHYRTDVPPDLMNREISGIFSGRISDVRDGGPVLSDKGRDTMNIMKNAEFPDDWLLGLRGSYATQCSMNYSNTAR